MKARGEIAAHCARARARTHGTRGYTMYTLAVCAYTAPAAASSLAPFPFAPIHQNTPETRNIAEAMRDSQ